MVRTLTLMFVVIATAVATVAGLATQQPQPLQFKYLGAAGWEVTDGRTVVLADPYLTRAKYPTPNDPADPADDRPLVSNNSIVPTNTAVVDENIKRADVIVLTHTHPDHSLDVPYIAKKTGATVVGTESTAILARANGVPEKQIRAVAGKEVLKFGDASIRVYIEAEVAGLRPDIALIGAMPERAYIDGYTPRLMKALGNPRVVIPTHWDRFNVPYSFSQQAARDRLQSFIAAPIAGSGFSC